MSERLFEPEIEHHSAQFYTTNAARVRGIAQYLLDGVENSEAVLLICSSANRTLVMDSVETLLAPEDHSKIEFVDSAWASDAVTVNGKISEALFRSHIYSIVQSDCGNAISTSLRLPLDSFRSFKSSHLFEDVCHLHTSIEDEAFGNPGNQAARDLFGNAHSQNRDFCSSNDGNQSKRVVIHSWIKF